MEKKFKYVVGKHTPSPFTSQASSEAKSNKQQQQDSAVKKATGGLDENRSLDYLKGKAFVKNSRNLRERKKRDEQKAGATATPETSKDKRKNQKMSKNKNNSGPKENDIIKISSKKSKHSSKYTIDTKTIQDQTVEGKLPKKLRKACDAKYRRLLSNDLKLSTNISRKQIKATASDKHMRESVMVMGTLSQSQSMLSLSLLGPDNSLITTGSLPTDGSLSFSPTRSQLEPQPLTEEEKINMRPQPPESELISGDAIMYSME